MASSELKAVPKEFTLCFLGCGDLGYGILKTLIKAVEAPNKSSEQPSRLPKKMIACVKSAASGNRLIEALKSHENLVTVMRGRNKDAIADTDIAILACQPHFVEQLLNESGVKEALKGKLLISIAAGWTTKQLESLVEIKGDTDSCRVVRTLPNIGAFISESLTAIEVSDNQSSTPDIEVTDSIFKQIGEIVHLPASQMDCATALGGSTPAFFAVICDSLIDAAVAMGMTRDAAKVTIYQAMRGSAGLLQSGESPEMLKEKGTSPGGCTIAGLMVLEERSLRGTLGKALREAISVASLLGKGYENVNGTRNVQS